MKTIPIIPPVTGNSSNIMGDVIKRKTGLNASIGIEVEMGDNLSDLVNNIIAITFNDPLAIMEYQKDSWMVGIP